MQLHECMVVNPITISPKATAAEALRLLRLKKLHPLQSLDVKNPWLVDPK